MFDLFGRKALREEQEDNRRLRIALTTATDQAKKASVAAADSAYRERQAYLRCAEIARTVASAEVRHAHGMDAIDVRLRMTARFLSENMWRDGHLFNMLGMMIEKELLNAGFVR